ncbi:TonB-dependent receptor [Arenibacter sp. S6351L]|uniref:TonB-dependent receptor n=1 Tax=Arenibacter sp. S6351L TaxID=2926407 RepID=UPI001FF60FFD|nr:TonB-dependent receptor [Arenibacter sp. S6351L]
MEIKKVLESIESLTDLKFFYNNKKIDVKKLVSVEVVNTPVSDVLDIIFQGTTIYYEIQKKQVLLKLGNAEKSPILNNKDRSSIDDEREVQQSVSGTVSNAEGPLPGVNVLLKGTINGTQTDFDGNYVLENVVAGDTFIFSYIGYKTKEVEVGNNTTLDVVLEEDVSNLEEVVIVGYGSQKKINLTGSVDVISKKDIENRPSPNIGTILQGLSPNLNVSISQDGGEPGHGMSFNIRGAGSLSGSSAPLILVDGIEMDVNYLDPNSVESVSILKDAAASAIYGSRAPFGVVLITTKKGNKNNEVSVGYNSNFGVSSPMFVPKWQSSLRFVTAMNIASANSGQPPKFSPGQVDRIQGYINGTYLPEYDTINPPSTFAQGRHQGNANYNLFDFLYRKHALRQSHSVNISGGSEKFQYYALAGYSSENGVYNYIDDDYKRYNLMVNLNAQATEWISFSLNTKFANSHARQPNGAFGLTKYQTLHEFTKMWPTDPIYVYDATAKDYHGEMRNPNINALKGAGLDDNIINDLVISLGSEIEPLKGWKTNFSYSYQLNSSKYSNHRVRVPTTSFAGLVGNIGAPVNGYSQNWGNNIYKTLSAISGYEKQIDNHYFKAMVGYEEEYQYNSSILGSGVNLITDDVPSIQTSAGPYTVNDAMDHWATQAAFTRINYNFKEKYLFEFNGRYSGSSKFAKNSRTGFFPSISTGYKIDKEEFWEPLKNTINNLKLRASYGALGNQNVDNYLYTPIVTTNSNLEWILNDSRPNYAGMPNIISPGLTWEKITMLDFGIDTELLRNRLGLNFDWYNRITTHMFGPVESLPAVLGTVPPQANNASMSTKGWEVTLTWKDNPSDNLNYNLRLTLANNKSVVTKYLNPLGLIDNFYVGKTIGEIWGYKTDQLIQSESEVIPDQSKFWPSWGPGDIKYKDLDGNGIIDDGNRTLSNHGDLSVIGNSSIGYTVGLSAGLQWKEFDFSMLWQGVGKADLWVPATSANRQFWGVVVGREASLYEGMKDFWRPSDDASILGPNTNAYFPKPYLTSEGNKNLQVQSRYLLDAAYLRLKNIQIGYTMPSKLSQKILIERLKIYTSISNVLTFTGFPKTLDPETSIVSNIPNSQGSQGSLGIGILYPLARTISFGLNITF